MTKNKDRPPTSAAINAKWQGLFDALNNESALICAVIATSYLDHCLWAMLAHRLAREDSKTHEELLKPNGAIGNLFAKSMLAYCLGDVTKTERENCRTIGEIRNKFAHKLDMQFDDKEVSDVCDKLILPTVADNGGDPPQFLQSISNCSRSRFVFVTMMICSRLMLNLLSAEAVAKQTTDQTTPA